MSNEQIRWLLKVIQPERTLASLPAGAGRSVELHASLLGLPPDAYLQHLEELRAEAKQAAQALMAEPGVAEMVERLPLPRGARIVALGDSLTTDPQSWAVMLQELLSARRSDCVLTITGVGGDTTTHALVRAGEVINQQPDWILVLLGTNDARTQGPHPSKTLVHAEETARNLAELRQRFARETKARVVWLTPPAVNESQVAAHAGLARFGVRFRNEALAGVAQTIRDLQAPYLDVFSALGAPPSAELLASDGLHLSSSGQKRVLRELLELWSRQS